MQILGVLDNDPGSISAHCESVLALDDAFRAQATAASNPAQQQEYARRVAAYLARMDEDPEAAAAESWKLRQLRPYLPEMYATRQAVDARLDGERNIWMEHAVTQSLKNAAQAFGDSKEVEVVKAEDIRPQPASRPTEKELRKQRDILRDSARYGLERVRIQNDRAAYDKKAETISFTLARPGLSLGVQHGPYADGDMPMKDFILRYDPGFFPIGSLIRRTFGSKPLQMALSDLRATSQTYLAGADGDFLQLYLKGATVPQRKAADGPLLMISRDTGRVLFFPPGFNTDSLNPLNFVMGLWTETQNYFFAGKRTGAWQALRQPELSVPASAHSTN